jgi:hypothetical protein
MTPYQSVALHEDLVGPRLKLPELATEIDGVVLEITLSLPALMYLGWSQTL